MNSIHFYIIILNLFNLYNCTNINKTNTAEQNTKILKQIDEMKLNSNIEQLLIDILHPRIQNIKCFVLICDNIYCNMLTNKLFKKFKLHVSYYLIKVLDSEDLLSPYNKTQKSLIEVKTEGCKYYIILIADGFKVSRFLRFGDRYRILNTRANFILLYDIRLFTKNLYYLWSRIINVIFIKENGGKSYSNKAVSIPWFDVSTVPFPSPIRGIFIPNRLDTWRKGHFRLGTDLFRDKTSDLRNQTVKVITFQHIPATVKTTVYVNENTTNIIYSGLEIETLAEQMNFQTSIYETENSDLEKWGLKQENKFSGLLGEMVNFKAEIALGDLYYSPYHLELMDLTIPYNTECLTFLTPESSTDNSWKTLILPFKLYMWLTMIAVIFIMGFIFHGLAVWQQFLYKSSTETTCVVFESKSLNPKTEKLNSPYKNVQFHKNKLQIVEETKKPEGLYIFEDKFNTFLYTFCMLLLISLPKVPDGWSLRIIIGWYFLYTTLVVVTYKASMTAILANPAPKITIDNLDELYESDLVCGGWSETGKEFFLTSLDRAGQKIGEKFEHVNDTDLAVERVAKGEFAYYENMYYLKAASVKRELLVQQLKQINHTVDSDRNLHIMSNCVINIPISLGLQKNSPIKPKIDTFLRRVIEGGFVKKWLNDVMQSTLTSEMLIDPETSDALMTLRKLYAGIGALFIGYFISFIALFVELIYWRFVVAKHPYFDKYTRTIYIPKQNQQN